VSGMCRFCWSGDAPTRPGSTVARRYRSGRWPCRSRPARPTPALPLAMRSGIRNDARVGYELRALIIPKALDRTLSRDVGIEPVALAHDLALIPITDATFDRLGGGGGRFEDTFFYLSSAVETIARQASFDAPVAYVEADIFGGSGTQAAIVWHEGAVLYGPVRADVGWPAREPTRPAWPFNYALRHLGVDRGDAVDEFEAAGLGRRRATEEWMGED
jgi:hypothetical protein